MRGVENVDDLDASQDQYVGNQATMTAPPYSFGTHQRRALLPGEVDQLRQSFCELFGREMICVSAERSIAPAGVGRIFVSTPAAAEFRKPSIGDAELLEPLRHGVLVELR